MHKSISFLKNKKILLTGGAGFVGRYVSQELQLLGINKEDIIIPRSSEYDLKNKDVCLQLTKNVGLSKIKRCFHKYFSALQYSIYMIKLSL